MKIFNSCLIKSPSNPLGVDLKTFPESTIIVHRNITRQHLNKVKADSLTSSSVLPELLRCTAWHTIGKKKVTAEVQSHLEQISTGDGLPPHLDLYIGAPVVLRNRNLSQELCITNGAQGIVRGILREMSPGSCASYATVALVEFESSPVKLSHLPTGYFPITPISSRIRASLHNPHTNSSFSILAMRHQLPIQLAFAITSHGAQGKTLSHVTADITVKKEGIAYVAVSRARSRHGLAITKEVTSLSQLNYPLPKDLLDETRRLDALQHNTLVQNGFLDNGFLVDVPDPEKKEGQEAPMIRLGVEVSKTHQDTGNCSKRKADGSGNNGHTPYQKRLKRDVPAADVVLAGCKWDHRNYSCAYDSAITPIVHLINEGSDLSQHAHGDSGVLLSSIEGVLSDLQKNNDVLTQTHLHNMQHFLRSRLFDMNPSLFPWGLSFAAIEDVLENICGQRPIMCPQVLCISCNCLPYDVPSQSLPCFPTLTGVECGKRLISSHTTSPLGVGDATWDEWWRGLAFSHIPPHDLQQYRKSCQHCGSPSGFTYSLKVSTAPKLIYFNTFGFPNLLPTP